MKQKQEKKSLLKFSFRIQIDGEEGMDQFARLLKVLWDNGFQTTVKKMVKVLIFRAKQRGLVVPEDVEKFAA